MLNELENEKLIADCQRCNLSYGEYFRRLLMNENIKEKPGKDFYVIMIQICKIGVILNQKEQNAKQTDKKDKDYYKSEADIWHKFAEEVKNKFLQEVVIWQ